MPPSSEIQFSSAELLDRDFADHKPRLSFDGDTVDAWRDWRTQLLPELREQLGPFPDEAFSSKPANRFHRSLRQVHNPQSDLPLTSGGCNSRLSVDPERRNGKDAPPSSASTDMYRAAKRASSPATESSGPLMVVIWQSRVSSRCAPIMPGWENALTRRAVVISSGDA